LMPLTAALAIPIAPAPRVWLPSSVVIGTAVGMGLPSLSGASALELDALRMPAGGADRTSAAGVKVGARGAH
jgi:hypothetical protein